MSVLQAVLDARAEAVARFTETFTAYTTVKTLNESTGLYDDVETALYAGVSGRVKFPSMNVSERAQAGQVPAQQDTEVHVAVGATPNVAVNVMWRITASTSDPSLVGRTYRTKGLAQAGQVSAHRYPVESVA